MTKQIDVEELKPCPFCGEKDDIVLKAKMHRGKPVEIDGAKYWYVECLPCDAQTGHHFDGDEEIYGGQTGKERAVNTWNRRDNTELEALRSKVEELEGENLEKLTKMIMSGITINGFPIPIDGLVIEIDGDSFELKKIS